LVTDVDGNTFIDLSGGIGVLAVGHTAPRVTEALKEQVERFLHTDFSVIPYESLVRLAEKLANLAPGDMPKKCGFFNSGAEAVENAVKFARCYTRRGALVTFDGAFHGRTLLCMTLTHKLRPYKEFYGPYAPEVYRIPYAYCYRCPFNLTYPGCDLKCASELDRLFQLTLSAENTAAVIIEPVQGEGGFIVPPPDYLPRIKELCTRYGIPLSVDEIQTGFGRTGRMFACEHSGVEPDLMTVAKSLAAGIPMSGVIGRQEIMDSAGDSTIGGTYVGNPLGCVAALAVLETFEEEDLLGRARAVGRRWADGFCAMQERYPVIGDVRALGAMVGAEFVKDPKTKEPAPDVLNGVLQRVISRGVVPIKCGLYGNVLRVLAPLTITDEQLDEALEVLETCISEVVGK